MYKDFSIFSLNRSLKRIKEKMNLGFPYEGARHSVTGTLLKKRKQLLHDKDFKNAIKAEVRKDWKDKHLRPILHSAFPKDYKDFVEKIELNPLKMRTIVSPDLISLIADLSLFRSTDDALKYLWRQTDTFIGAPFTGSAINYILDKLCPASQCLILDLKKYDSTLPYITPKLIAKLYAPGFTHYSTSDRKVIENQLEARLDRYYSGGLIKALEHGSILPHMRGMTTGSVSVTRINVEVSRLCLIYTLSEMIGCSMKEAFEKTDRCLMGDDLPFQLKDDIVDSSELLEKLRELTGLEAKIDYEDVDRTGNRLASFDGAKFLSHYISKVDEQTEQELNMAGIIRGSHLFPTYTIQHDKEKAAMRQTVGLRRTKPSQDWDSALSLAEKSVHSPDHYNEACIQMRSCRARLMKERGGFKYMRKRPFPSYNEVLRKFYTRVAKLKIYTPRPIRNIERVCNFVSEGAIATSNVLAVIQATGFEQLGAERIGTGVNHILALSTYTVESHVYCCLQMNDPSVPYETYQSIVAQNAFSIVTDPRQAYNFLRAEVDHRTLSQVYKARLAWLYICLLHCSESCHN